MISSDLKKLRVTKRNLWWTDWVLQSSVVRDWQKKNFICFFTDAIYMLNYF